MMKPSCTAPRMLLTVMASIDAAKISPAEVITPPVAAKAAEPVLLSSGVVATQTLAPMPGSSDPITPTRVKTVAVRAGSVKTAMPVMAALPAQIAEVPPAAPTQTASIPRSDLPQQPAGAGSGHGILGVLPASAMAYADPKPAAQPAPAASIAPVQRVAAVAPAPVAAARLRPADVRHRPDLLRPS